MIVHIKSALVGWGKVHIISVPPKRGAIDDHFVFVVLPCARA